MVEPDPGRESPTAINVANAVHATLLEYFEDEAATAAFLRAFSGLTLKMPSPVVVEQILRDKRVHVELARDPSTNAVRRLADHHGVPLRVIAKSFAKSNGTGLKQVRASCKAA